MATAVKKNKPKPSPKNQELNIEPQIDTTPEEEKPVAEAEKPVIVEEEPITETEKPVAEEEPIVEEVENAESNQIEESDQANKTTTIPPQPRFSKGLIITFIAVIILVAVIIGGILYSRSVSTKQIEIEPTSTPAPTATSTPTPEEVNLSDYSLQIQNGSGTPGEAGKVQKILETEGFEDIEATNADSYDYKNTQVLVKEDVPNQVYQAIDQALNDQYTPEKLPLKASSDYDVVVIVGKRL